MRGHPRPFVTSQRVIDQHQRHLVKQYWIIALTQIHIAKFGEIFRFQYRAMFLGGQICILVNNWLKSNTNWLRHKRIELEIKETNKAVKKCQSVRMLLLSSYGLTYSAKISRKRCTKSNLKINP